MIEINIESKNDEIFPMIKSFIENNPCSKIIIYTKTTEEEVVENTNVKHDDFDLERELYAILKQIGYPMNLLGYKYIIDAILMYIKNGRNIHGITKYFYPKIAKKYGSTSSGVERAIRHGINVSWLRGDIDFIQSVFGYTVSSNSDKPTNGQYIASLGEELLRRKEQPYEN